MLKSKISKGFFSFLLLMIFVCVGQISVKGVENQEVESREEVEYTFNEIFPDQNLAIGVAQAMRGDQATLESTVTVAELNSFNNNDDLLVLDRRRIQNLEGLQYLTSITRLSLSGNGISNLTPLSELTSLVDLRLAQNSIRNLTPLSKLTSLQTLDLRNNSIADISPLSELTSLMWLYIISNDKDVWGMGITELDDLTPLSNLTSLRGLFAGSNGIRDLSPLSDLVNLLYLELGDNNISDITPLKNLVNLLEVSLSMNQIKDITPLSNLTRLRQLNLMMNQITDLTPLDNLTSITSLIAIDQRIILDQIIEGQTVEVNIKDRNGLTPTITFGANGGSYNYEQGTILWGSLGNNNLSWSGNNFTGTITQYVEEKREKLTFLDFFPDENLAQGVAEYYGRVATDRVTADELEGRTEELILNDLGVKNLEGMQYFTNLRVLRLADNEIEDLSPLNELTNLRYLTLQNNNISDLEPLNALNVTNLWLASNQITNIEPLSQLTTLRELGLNHNQITDVSALSELPLTYLVLSHNHLLDISPVGFVEELTATNQRITLDPINQGDVTEGIFINAANGQTPATITFNPIGGSYNVENGTITWGAVGENTLTWSDVNFSGTISQIVNP